MTARQFFRIVEIRTKIISMATFICASLYAVYDSGSWSWLRFLLMAVAVLCVDMGTTGFNSYYDYINGTDNKHYNLEKDKVLVHDGVNPLAALIISLGLFGCAAILGLMLASMTSWYLILAGGACMLVGYAYTGGPFPISRTPFGELFAGLFLGTILFLITYFVISESVTLAAALASIPLLLLIAMILSINNACDHDADIIAGRNTVAIFLGKRINKWVLRTQLIIGYASVPILVVFSIFPYTVVPFFSIASIVAVKEFITMEKRGFSLETKGPSMGGISKIFLSLVFSMILGLALALLLL
ncbi:MAG: prenyltransferase [Sphaerochaetaceae bacterium]|jgi:1,4-dihydroxy-2-naphthoate octaprenyltransferase|nr:prenyltransferase [Sphaerochaetaceae bacterium]NLO59599.1 prenyltransferase [Spirochaetales bacterium]MDD2406644.1 prenyltransferase [Sphaerochaetaceae bacterium]MDD4260022.1 prenyltransferase [Sphaerochaetaceae bacterium]MDD4762964.1 prenyltransferase [Sphaerochaetaceae bacterium]